MYKTEIVQNLVHHEPQCLYRFLYTYISAYTVYTPNTSVLYVRICRCTIWRYVHKSTLFPTATDRFSNETFPSTYCEDDHSQYILIYPCWFRKYNKYIFSLYILRKQVPFSPPVCGVCRGGGEHVHGELDRGLQGRFLEDRGPVIHTLRLRTQTRPDHT